MSCVGSRLEEEEGKEPGFLRLEMLFPCVLILDYSRVLFREWETNPQYAYGFFIPLLALWLVRSRIEMPASEPFNDCGWPRIGLLAWALVPVLPVLNVILGANPDWRLLFWLHGTLLLLAGACWGVEAMGFGALKHLWPVGVLLLFGIPWPMVVEQRLVNELMGLVAATVAEVLPFFGVVAERAGNLIRTSGGYVGVEEACSGIRSFQLALVAGFVVGELGSLNCFRRLLLLALAVAGSFLVNLARTFLLVAVFVRGGEAAIAQWHDGVAAVAMVLTVFWVATFGSLLGARFGVAKPLRTKGALPGRRGRWQWAVLLSLLLSPLVAEVWFRLHERSLEPFKRLSVEAARLPEGSEAIELPSSTVAALRFESADAWAIPAGGGLRLTLYRFGWDSGRISSMAGVHRPEVCLPSAGYDFLREYGYARWLWIDGSRFGLRTFEFAHRDRSVFVYFAVRDGRGVEAAAPPRNAWDRVEHAFDGRRIVARDVLEIAVSGATSEDVAWQFAEPVLQHAIVLN